MQNHPISRRQFIERTAAIAGGVILSPLAARAAAKKTAVDIVPLGKTGLKACRLSFGCGTSSGRVQQGLGQDGLQPPDPLCLRSGHHAHRHRPVLPHARRCSGEAIKGLPREKLFIQTKMGGSPENPLQEIDNYRKTYGVDYIDSLLVHCSVKPNWEEERKRVMDAMQEAKDKKIILSHGVSCHSLPALKRAVELDWVDVHLVRVNPQGVMMDTPRTDS